MAIRKKKTSKKHIYKHQKSRFINSDFYSQINTITEKKKKLMKLIFKRKEEKVHLLFILEK